MLTLLRRWSVCGIVLLCCLQSLAQEEPGDELAIFRSEVDLATVQVRVTSSNRFLRGLSASDFELKEDGRTVPITVFDGSRIAVQELPIEVLLLLDNSGSVTDKKLLSEELFRTNLLEGLPGVSLSIYRFGSSLTRMTASTRDAERIRAAFEGVVQKAQGEVTMQLGPPPGPSLIYEAIAATIIDAMQVRSATAKLLVVVSDGLQNGGASRPKGIEEVALEAGIPVYPIVVLPRWERRRGDDLLVERFQEIGAATGGKSFRVRRLDDETVKGIIEFIADHVRHVYVLGFSPERHEKPHRHRVQVRLRAEEKGKVLGGRRVVVH